MPSGSTCTNGSSSYAACSASRRAASVVPADNRAVQVARIPRGIGASTGVNDSVTPVPAAADSDCSISGVCWCTPPALYGDSAPITSLPSSAALADRPAPEVPDAATTTTSAGSTSPAASSGASPRTTVVA